MSLDEKSRKGGDNQMTHKLPQSTPAHVLNAQRPLTLVPDRIGSEASGGRLATKSHRESCIPAGGYPRAPRTARPRETTWTYITRTVKAKRCLPDGTWQTYLHTETVKVPFIAPRATPVRTPRATVARPTQRLDKSECAAMPMAQDLNEQ